MDNYLRGKYLFVYERCFLSQVVMEGVRGAGIEGDIAIDDVTIEEGECKNLPPNSKPTFLLTNKSNVSAKFVSPSIILFDLLRSEVSGSAPFPSYMAAEPLPESVSDWPAEMTPPNTVGAILHPFTALIFRCWIFAPTFRNNPSLLQ